MPNYYSGVSANQLDVNSYFKDDTQGLPQNYYSLLASNGYQDFLMKGEYEWAIAKPCKPGTVTEIDTALRNFFNFLRGIQEYGDTFINGTLGEAQNLTYEISKTVSIVSGVLRTFTQRLRNFIMGLLKELIQGAIQCLLTPLLDQIKDTVFGAILDQLMCKFDEIMDNLKNIVSDFLFALVNLAINNPTLCAVEAFTNSLLNNLANTIDQEIQPVLDQVSDMLGGAAQVVGSVFSVVNQVLAFEGLLCSEPKCPEDVEKFKTGPFGGPQRSQAENFNNMISGPSTGLSNFNQSATAWLNETFPENSNNSGSPCYTGPYECGSPQVVFFGGGGSGASANAVVNGIGQVIGVNLLSGGTGYTTPPFVSIVDPAGCGAGAQAYSVISPPTGVGSTGGSPVSYVNLGSPGTGYSQNNNGGVAQINFFYGTPNPVQVGNSITLTWEVNNYTTLALSTGGNTIEGYGNISTGSTTASFVINTSDVQFAAGSNVTTKTYTLTATTTNENSASQTVSQNYTFSVSSVPVTADTTTPTTPNAATPIINSFTGSPGIGTTLAPGSILTLSWETTNATSVSLSPAPSSTTTLPVDGSISYTVPTNSSTTGIITSYTLTATNSNAPSGQQTTSQIISYTIAPTGGTTAGTGAGTGTGTGVGIGTTTGIPVGTGQTGGGGTFAVSYLSSIPILEGGINYNTNDTVSIVGGNNGAVLQLQTTALGQVVAVNILSPGYGFTTIPEIEINSLNGVGAKFLPQLQFIPLDQFLAEQDLESVDPGKLVQIIDCVYK